MYAIYADDVCIYNDTFGFENRQLTDPKLTLEDNSAGSLTITLPPTNIGYKTIVRMVTDISVRKHDKEIWAGRVLSEDMDFFNNRTLYCEGELAFFNDTTQPSAEYHNITVRGFLETLIENHNQKVAANRQFTVGVVSVIDPNDSLYRYTNKEKTIECINEKLIKRLGGHLRIRKENGKRYLDYLADYPTTNSQVIQFGQNLLDFTRKWDMSEYATVILPLGNRLEESPIEALDAYLTVESENEGSMYVQNASAVAAYGWIEKVVSWNDVSTASALLRKAKQYLSDLQFDNMEIELKAVDMHYLDVDYEAIKLLDAIRVVSSVHGMNRYFPVTKLEIPLDSPENTAFTLGDTVKTSLTGVNNKTSASILEKIESLPRAETILKEASANATEIMNMATTGYVTIVKDDIGAESLYISDTRDYQNARRLWKWNLNGLGYSNDGGRIFGLAITMDGAIVADYITAGILNAGVIRTGILQDYGENVIFDLDSGKLTMKKGSISIGGAFSVSEDGTLTASKGKFSGVVQASDFLDKYGNSMMDGTKFSSEYLDLYGLTIRNKSTNDVTFNVGENGDVTINAKVAMGSGSSIDWSLVSNKNLYSNPAYSRADDAYTEALSANSLASSAYQRANEAYTKADSIYLPSYIQSTYIDATTIRSPTIEGGAFYGNTFNVISENDSGSFNLYGQFNSLRQNVLKINYYNGDAPYIWFTSPINGVAEWDFGITYFNGTVNFSNATIVSGLNANSISLSSAKNISSYLDKLNDSSIEKPSVEDETILNESVNLFAEDGKLKIKVGDAIWYLDENGLHR